MPLQDRFDKLVLDHKIFNQILTKGFVFQIYVLIEKTKPNKIFGSARIKYVPLFPSLIFTFFSSLPVHFLSCRWLHWAWFETTAVDWRRASRFLVNVSFSSASAAFSRTPRTISSGAFSTNCYITRKLLDCGMTATSKSKQLTINVIPFLLINFVVDLRRCTQERGRVNEILYYSKYCSFFCCNASSVMTHSSAWVWPGVSMYGF